MLSLLRNIRRSLLSRGATRRYMLYAFGEFILIVAGILVAMEINNWNEWRKDREKEKEALVQIRLNLFEDIQAYDQWTDQFHVPITNYLTFIADENYEMVSLDSFVIMINTYFSYQQIDAAYTGLRSEGSLSIIKNNDLRNNIIFYYESRAEQLQSYSQWQQQFVLKHIEGFILDQIPIGHNNTVLSIPVLTEHLQNSNLLSVINYQISALRLIDLNVKYNRQVANGLIELITKELGES